VNGRDHLTLAQMIAALPEEERVILTLYFGKNLSISEIAGKIGVPERAVVSVLIAGRARIQAAFNFPSGEEMGDNSPS
jgi:DNA-directed RNA polymerase specialized sigma24 family protein